MLTGMAMLAAVGLLWACNGVIMSVAERRGLLATELFCVSTALSLIVGLAMVFRDGTRMDISLSVGCVLAALMALAGAASILGAVCTQKAMSGGHNGVVWVVSQAALVLPFLMGSLAFDERFTWNGVTGLGCVLLCLTLFGACRQSGGQTAVHAPNWLTLTLGAFLLNGVCQCLASLPSYWRLPGLSAALRGDVPSGWSDAGHADPSCRPGQTARMEFPLAGAGFGHHRIRKPVLAAFPGA